jgi:negative regulator of sigma E activity
MIDEQLEFAISQYFDGVLSDAERTALERRLKEDVEAAAMLEEYRRLNAVLKSGAGLPVLRWDAFATAVSSAIDAADARHEEEAAARFRIPRWVRTVAIPMAMAASVLVATGMGIHSIWFGSHGANPQVAHVVVQQPESFASVSVFGSQVQSNSDQDDVHVVIGPSIDSKGEPIVVRYGGDLVSRASHVSVASGVTPVHDSGSLLFDAE